jgi:hypothetical protein
MLRKLYKILYKDVGAMIHTKKRNTDSASLEIRQKDRYKTLSLKLELQD